MPSGERLAKVQKSPHYKNGSFQNRSVTPSLAEGYSTTKVFYDFFFTKYPQTIPVAQIPTTKTDLRTLPSEEDMLVWMGHSSYYFQLAGKRFLVDPVLSGNASPIPNSNRAFEGTDVYTPDDLPEIDYLLISHDHYDHLDYITIKALRSKVKQVICGLGVGQHFEYWGYDPAKIKELDWFEDLSLENNIRLRTHSARHFSGRSFKRNTSLWLSYIILTPDFKMYLGGDSGYDTHFKEIGQQFGSIDLAILENGQYNKAWQYIHCLPEETLQAAVDVKAKRFLPVHSSKFKLAHHTWFEPLEQVYSLNQATHRIPMLTPIIGQKVLLTDTTQQFDAWWKGRE
jgi:L-ascorbate metabolism protein UlaG (beta-lactamase superfamily)